MILFVQIVLISFFLYCIDEEQYNRTLYYQLQYESAYFAKEKQSKFQSSIVIGHRQDSGVGATTLTKELVQFFLRSW